MKTLTFWAATALLGLTSPALAQSNPQQIPPAQPVLQYAGQTSDGEATFVEVGTFGLWQGRGYGWLLRFHPSDPQPVWVREIVDCRTKAITDDYVVWLDGESLAPYAFSDAGFPMSQQTHSPASVIETAFANAACSGGPPHPGPRVTSVREAITYAQSHAGA